MDRNRRQPSPSGRSTAAEGRSSICLTPTVHPSAFVCGVDDFLKIYLWLLLAPIAANYLLALSSQSTAGGFTTLRSTSLGLHLPLFSWISTFRLWQTSKSYWLTKFAMGKLIFYDFSQCRHILHLYHKNTIRISLNFFVTDLRSTDLPRLGFPIKANGGNGDWQASGRWAPSCRPLHQPDPGQCRREGPLIHVDECVYWQWSVHMKLFLWSGTGIEQERPWACSFRGPAEYALYSFVCSKLQ